jgi:UDP-N-acetyl-D-galactosamine dehydrogenase
MTHMRISTKLKYEYGIELVKKPKKYDAVILAVAHDVFLSMDMNLLKGTQNSVVFDIKAVLDRKNIDGRL